VGQNKDPFSLVRCTNGGCSYTPCLSHETESGKVSDDEGESASKSEGRDVLKEDQLGLNVANNRGDGRPDPPLVLDAYAVAGGAPRLAGETGSDNIHVSTPTSPLEGE
jgi:hypothetical protein